jgi:hypothetical protein
MGACSEVYLFKTWGASSEKMGASSEEKWELHLKKRELHLKWTCYKLLKNNYLQANFLTIYSLNTLDTFNLNTV